LAWLLRDSATPIRATATPWLLSRGSQTRGFRGTAREAVEWCPCTARRKQIAELSALRVVLTMKGRATAHCDAAGLGLPSPFAVLWRYVA
jgi:hypothetical protein